MRKDADRNDGIPSYLSRLTRAPLLTSEEEVVLTRAAQRGDGHARERLIESNMRLVINIAKNYRNKTIPLEDLIQDGAIGLMHAVERFDPGRGYRFSTYATHWIRQAIGRAIDNKSKAIRLPAHISQTLRKIERTKARVMREQGSEATADQIARELGITNKRLQMLLLASQDLLSLDMNVGDGDSTSLGSLIEDQLAANPESVVITSEVVDELHAIMNQLNDRERKVIMYRLKFVEPRDGTSFRDELSQEFQVSRERIRQIEVQAIKKLRQVARRRRLREYLS